ncbi:SH3 domain-containing protein [Glutamicibacter endophyticus]|uniref:SH3 domain-containing protein n=1 Tax=Glutamicibacter endophyticus TaxID=1522174 RepID=UPI003AF011A5
MTYRHPKSILMLLAIVASLSLVVSPAGAGTVATPSTVIEESEANAAFVGSATTTANLHLRSQPTSSSTSLGVMAYGSKIWLTGSVSGDWAKAVWGSRNGWVHTNYIRYGTASTSQYRYAQYTGATYDRADRATGQRVGTIRKYTKVEYRAWDAVNKRDNIKLNGRWVWTSATNRYPPKIEYRYAQYTATVYDRADPGSDKAVGTLHVGTKVKFATWNATHRRDEVWHNGRWVWASNTDRSAPRAEYRYAQRNGATYDRADKNTAQRVGSIACGTRVRYSRWSSANRGDEVWHNGRWVWTEVTNRPQPDCVPPTTSVDPYGRFTEHRVPLRKTPKAYPYDSAILWMNPGMKVTVTGTAPGGWVRVKYGKYTGYVIAANDLVRAAPYSVAVYGTLRTGQSAYNVMDGWQQKIMDQRIANTSLYQLWNPNWTFLTDGPKSVVAEQFQYSPSRGPGMLQKLDVYEGQLKYDGRPMYTRQRVTMTDGSQSWTYKTTDFSERVVKESGRYIDSGDFLKRS